MKWDTWGLDYKTLWIHNLQEIDNQIFVYLGYSPNLNKELKVEGPVANVIKLFTAVITSLSA